jgi:type IV secretion system protein VirB4
MYGGSTQQPTPPPNHRTGLFAASSVLPGWAAPHGPRYWEPGAKESNVGEFVAIIAPLTPRDTATRAGDCLRVWRIDGVAFESAEHHLIQDRHDAWCNVLRNLPAGRTAVYHRRIHRRIHDRLSDAAEPELSAAFSWGYQDRISVAPMMSNELYITAHEMSLAEHSLKFAEHSFCDRQNNPLSFG